MKSSDRKYTVLKIIYNKEIKKIFKNTTFLFVVYLKACNSVLSQMSNLRLEQGLFFIFGQDTKTLRDKWMCVWNLHTIKKQVQSQ